MSAFLLGIGFRADMGTCARKLVLLKLIDACEDDGSRWSSKAKDRAFAGRGLSGVCDSSALTGDDWTSAPGAYIPAVSISGTAANRGRLGSDTQTDTPDEPASQTSGNIRPIRQNRNAPVRRLST